MGFRFFLIAALLSPPAYSIISGNTFSDTKSGFAISKPADWQFVKEVKSYGLQLKEGRLMKPSHDFLVAFTKKMKASFRGVAPSVSVSHLDLGKAAPTDWLNEELSRHQAHDKYFVQASQAMPTKIGDDESASRAAFINNTLINGVDAHAYHVLYIVRSKGKAFLIHMNCNDDQASDYVDIFSEIAGSIEVQ